MQRLDLRAGLVAEVEDDIAAASRAEGRRYHRAGKIADAEVIRVVAAPLIHVVFDGQDVIARLGEGVVDLGVFAQAGEVVAVGDLAARGGKQPQRRIEGRADAAGENLQRKPLPGFDMKLVELADQRLSGGVDRSREAHVLRGGGSCVARPRSDDGQIIDQEQPQRRNAVVRRDPHAVEARRRLGGDGDAERDFARVRAVVLLRREDRLPVKTCPEGGRAGQITTTNHDVLGLAGTEAERRKRRNRRRLSLRR